MHRSANITGNGFPNTVSSVVNTKSHFSLRPALLATKQEVVLSWICHCGDMFIRGPTLPKPDKSTYVQTFRQILCKRRHFRCGMVAHCHPYLLYTFASMWTVHRIESTSCGGIRPSAWCIEIWRQRGATILELK